MNMASKVELYKVQRYIECLRECRDQGCNEEECVKICMKLIYDIK